MFSWPTGWQTRCGPDINHVVKVCCVCDIILIHNCLSSNNAGACEEVLHVDWFRISSSSWYVWPLWISWYSNVTPIWYPSYIVLPHATPRTYATEADLLQEGNSLHLRPFQLPFRIDYGLRGTSDAEPSFELIIYCNLWIDVKPPNIIDQSDWTYASNSCWHGIAN